MEKNTLRSFLTIMEDNQGAIAMTKQPVAHKETVHTCMYDAIVLVHKRSWVTFNCDIGTLKR